jgi:uncharacterized membrane protein
MLKETVRRKTCRLVMFWKKGIRKSESHSSSKGFGRGPYGFRLTFKSYNFTLEYSILGMHAPVQVIVVNLTSSFAGIL